MCDGNPISAASFPVLWTSISGLFAYLICCGDKVLRRLASSDTQRATAYIFNVYRVAWSHRHDGHTRRGEDQFVDLAFDALRDDNTMCRVRVKGKVYAGAAQAGDQSEVLYLPSDPSLFEFADVLHPVQDGPQDERTCCCMCCFTKCLPAVGVFSALVGVCIGLFSNTCWTYPLAYLLEQGAAVWAIDRFLFPLIYRKRTGDISISAAECDGNSLEEEQRSLIAAGGVETVQATVADGTQGPQAQNATGATFGSMNYGGLNYGP